MSARRSQRRTALQTSSALTARGCPDRRAAAAASSAPPAPAARWRPGTPRRSGRSLPGVRLPSSCRSPLRPLPALARRSAPAPPSQAATARVSASSSRRARLPPSVSRLRWRGLCGAGKCVGGEMERIFPSPLSFDAFCVSRLPMLLEMDACATVADWKDKKCLLALVGLSLTNIFFCLCLVASKIPKLYKISITSNLYIESLNACMKY